MNTRKAMRIMKALGDGFRFEIVQVLANGAKTASDLLDEFEISQPNLSRQMKDLENLEIVTTQKQGLYTLYSLNVDEYEDFLQTLSSFLPDRTV